MEMKDIERINELYRKKKAGTITAAELEEQALLRGRYLADLRRNLRSQLETIRIQNPDGTIIDVKKRHDEKYGGSQ